MAKFIGIGNVMKGSETKYSEKTHFLTELAGSFGNFGTLLPILFAVSFACGMNLSLMLLWAAIWYGISGLYYRIPISIEPLKAIAAIAIADHLAPGLIAAGGILMGGICYLIGTLGGMDRIKTIIPEAVIRGVQLGLAFILIKSAIPEFILPDIPFAAVSAGILCIFFFVTRFLKIPDLSALFIMVTGFLLAIYHSGMPVIGVFPLPALVIPTTAEFLTATFMLLPPQIPLTLTNAILATSLLVSDLFGKEESPDRLSRTIGLMSISSSVFGGFPMCHGAGGVAAHYRFGARKGISLIFGGLILLLIAIICIDPDIVNALPKGMFGILLVAVAIELARHGIMTKSLPLTVLIALLSIPFGLAVAFCAGLIIAWVIQYQKKKAEPKNL